MPNKKQEKNKKYPSDISLKIALIIIAISLVIITSGLAIGSQFLTTAVETSIEDDMVVAVEIADKYVTREIDLLKVMALDAAKDIRRMYEDGRSEGVLRTVLEDYPMYIGLAVLNDTHIVDSYSETDIPLQLAREPFVKAALNGQQLLSTTMFTPDDVLVMYVSAPISDGLALVAVLPGLYFRELIAQFTFWESGHLFIDDEEGTIIANIRPEWVEQRVNFIRMAETDSSYAEVAEMLLRTFDEGHAIGQFSIAGIPRISAMRTLSAPYDNWLIGIIAPLNETVLVQVPQGIALIGSITLLLSIIAAIFAASYLKRPFIEAYEASATKSAFLANMSHEIRTPLTAVLGLSELILTTVPLDDETHSNVIKINKAGDTLLSLVNDILDISKIEAGKFTLNIDKYALSSLINDTVTQSILYAGEKPIELVLDITDDLPAELIGDELRVKQILSNLLSNAFKFTEEGTVELYMRCRREGDDILLTARVSDTGIGIKPDDIGNLFTLYGKMATDSTGRADRRIEGTGLGLAIAKKSAEMMDGTIDVQSEYGTGSVFTVSLRQKYVSDEIIGARTVESLKKFHYSNGKFNRTGIKYLNMSYARVLVVDDNSTNLDVAKGFLGLYKLQIDCAVSGKQAVDAIRDEKVRYDAVFMDHMMPEMDGIEATRIIREDIGTAYAKSVPIIALTANAIVGNEEIFLRKGFQAFISKPIDPARLDTVLRQWVRDKKAESLLPDIYVSYTDVRTGERSLLCSDISGLDIAKGISRFLNETTYIELLRSFSVNTKPLLDLLSNTYDAATAGNAGSAESLSKYSVTVHGIKGSARGICAYETGDAAESLEDASKRGDLEFVKAHHREFIESVSLLISDIDDALSKMPGTEKPVKGSIDRDVLKKLHDACLSYDSDAIDEALDEINCYAYTSDSELCAWLRANLERGDIKAVTGKLQDLLGG